MTHPRGAVAALVAAAEARTDRVTAERALALYEQGEVLFVDVREGDELVTAGVIPGAQHAARGELELRVDPDSDEHDPAITSGRPLILVSSAGRRAALAAATLVDLGMQDVAWLDGGLVAWFEAGGPLLKPTTTPEPAKVTGVGGVFLSAADPVALRAWYRDRLGFPARIGPSVAEGSHVFPWRDALDPEVSGQTVWAIFPADSPHIGDAGFMINYRVDDLDRLLERLAGWGVEVLDGPQDHDNGRFAWIADPEGHRIELWQPAD